MIKFSILYIIALGALFSPSLRAQISTCEASLIPDVIGAPELTDDVLAHIVNGDIVIQTGRVPGRKFSRDVPKLDGGMHTLDGLQAFLKQRDSAGAPIEDLEVAVKNPIQSLYSHQKNGDSTISRVPTFTLLTFKSGIYEVTLPEEAISYKLLMKSRDFEKLKRESTNGLFSDQAKVITLFPKVENPTTKIKQWINRVLDGKNTKKVINENGFTTNYFGWIIYNKANNETSSFKMKVVVNNNLNKVMSAYPVVTENSTVGVAETIFSLGIAICAAKDASLLPSQKLTNYAVDLKNMLYDIEKTELSAHLKPQPRKALFKLRDEDSSPEKTFKAVYKIFSKISRQSPKSLKENYIKVLKLIEQQENYN